MKANATFPVSAQDTHGEQSRFVVASIWKTDPSGADVKDVIKALENGVGKPVDQKLFSKVDWGSTKSIAFCTTAQTK